MVIRMDYQRACSCRGAGYANANFVGQQTGNRSQSDYQSGKCGCTPSDEYAPNKFEYPSLAMMYAPYQKFDCLYEPAEALKNATLFKELNKPFLAGRRGGGR